MDKEQLARGTQIYAEVIGGALRRLDLEMIANGWKNEELRLSRIGMLKTFLKRERMGT